MTNTALEFTRRQALKEGLLIDVTDESRKEGLHPAAIESGLWKRHFDPLALAERQRRIQRTRNALRRVKETFHADLATSEHSEVPAVGFGSSLVEFHRIKSWDEEMSILFRMEYSDDPGRNQSRRKDGEPVIIKALYRGDDDFRWCITLMFPDDEYLAGQNGWFRQ